MTAMMTDITALAQSIHSNAQTLVAAFRARPTTPPAQHASPVTLAEALDRFLEVLKRADADLSTGVKHLPRGQQADDVTQIGEYGLQLMEDLSRWAEPLNVPEAGRALLDASVPLALWVARGGGQLSTLEPVVDALARRANTTTAPRQLAELSALMSELLNAVDPTIAADLDTSNPGRPWRVLNLNRGIVATRSHDPQLMRTVFDEIVQRLPADAPRFFREGMEQMDALNYPPHVRSVMQDYFSRYSARTLH